jgi:predicted dehydrogenase
MNVGLVGLKGHQGVVLNELREAGCRLVAVCDDNPEALAGVPAWPSASSETKTYDSFSEMLDREKLDIICEAGTDNLRGGIVRACAERGVHVICEKPLAFTLEELGQVRQAVDTSGIRLTMLLTMRFEPAYRLLREQVASGVIGEVCQASMQKSYRLGTRPAWQCSRETFSGIIPFIGIHALDLISFTSGHDFARGAAFCANTGHPETGDLEDNACIALQLDNGASAAARLDYCRPAAAPTHGDDRLRIAGSAGVIESLACGTQVTLITAEEGPRELPLPQPGKQFVNFVRSIQGEETCEAPAAECFRISEVVLKLREAARERQLVDLVGLR